MNETTILRENILFELDHLLNLKGYKRPKREHAWYNKISPEQTFFIHLNFGLYEKYGKISITPSISLGSQWLTDRMIECNLIKSKHTKNIAQFYKTLTSLSDHLYDYGIKDNPRSIANILYQDIIDFGVPYLEQIKNYEFIISLLQKDEGKKWPVFSRSDRARYLPLLLAMTGKNSEAIEVLQLMETDIQGRDQIIPSFDHFKNWFINRFSKI